MKIKWNTKLETGYSQIDDEHKRLVEIINDVFDHVSMFNNTKISERDEFFLRVLTELDDYVDYHFGQEEELMKKYDFPGSQIHMAQHKSMKEHIKNISFYNIANNKEEVTNLLTFFCDWLIGHIMKSDHELGEFLLKASYV